MRMGIQQLTFSVKSWRRLGVWLLSYGYEINCMLHSWACVLCCFYFLYFSVDDNFSEKVIASINFEKLTDPS